ncbi:hypothetical protein JY651_49650 [Pyxidicoccus parkwayensis]|uniref:Uncharacterized protein n=1 Tax=Pyxidicoccus parkwayensis TaxID=2813578 RepID=A0ABX7NW19_9BACT|nr:hypothetical protein [Pyxidicoccus parkwaysis]QSQ23069.1 hypothetical protein JY651_49650 [Pyxidicoccus parkwaysis]
MTERIRSGGVTGEALSTEDIRRRLEGRAEVIEAARTRQAALESVLGARRWKRRLRARPELVPQWLEHAPAVAEALDRTGRRAEVEGWPEDTPVLVAARELVEGGKRLTELVRRRLALLAPVSGAASLQEDLSRLDALVRKEAALTLAPGEVLVFDGQRKWQASPHIPPLALLLLLCTGALVVSGVLVDKVFGLGGGLSLLLMMAAIAPLMGVALRSGRAWLTSERLVWQPVLGEAVSVPLESIPLGGIHVHPELLGVRVEGERKVHVRHLQDSHQLAVLVELHRQPPLRGVARAGVKLADVAIYPATLTDVMGRHKGYAVLRPDGVSFIPGGQGTAALHAVTGTAVELPVETEWVLEQLRWLPDTEFDACVARVVKATGGQRWSAWESSYRAGAPVWKEIRITQGPAVLTGGVDWSRQDATERILRSWPRSTPGGR